MGCGSVRGIAYDADFALVEAFEGVLVEIKDPPDVEILLDEFEELHDVGAEALEVSDGFRAVCGQRGAAVVGPVLVGGAEANEVELFAVVDGEG